MKVVDKPEIEKLRKELFNMFKDPNLLGYEYLGDWKDREE